MRRIAIATVLAACAISCVIPAASGGETIKGPYQPTWESLKKHQTPEWLKDAKFGIFIHWGVYSVPAWAPEWTYSEWYPYRMYREGTETYKFHKEHYGLPSEFGYADFIPQFKAENWDPDRWAELFKKAGVRYVLPVAEHHDGFAMWDSELTDWNAAKMGPKRDIIGELETAVRKRGMKYAPTYHRAQHWWYYPYKPEYDTTDPARAGLYWKPHSHSQQPSEEFVKDWKARWEEIRDKYQPDMAWFDWKWQEPAFRQAAKEIMADYYNKAETEWGKEVAINNKTLKSPPMFPADVGDLIEMDYMEMATISRIYWENPRGIGKSFAYNRNEEPEDYDTTNELIDEFMDVISKNGNLLLDVGPKADGTIPELQRQRLLEMGQWLEVNGEAVYGTRPWTVCQEDNIRFTRKDDAVYVICLEWPGEKLTVGTMSSVSARCPQEIQSVSMLGVDGELDWSRNTSGLTVNLPQQKPCQHAYVVKVVLSE